jgi:hypothetical protein
VLIIWLWLVEVEDQLQTQQGAVEVALVVFVLEQVFR